MALLRDVYGGTENGVTELEKTTNEAGGTARTVRHDGEEESAVVWSQLLQLAESGDIRAIKLYYEMLERRRRIRENRERSAYRQDIEELCEIRRAVFGDAAIHEDLLACEEWIRAVMLRDPSEGSEGDEEHVSVTAFSPADESAQEDVYDAADEF